MAIKHFVKYNILPQSFLKPQATISQSYGFSQIRSRSDPSLGFATLQKYRVFRLKIGSVAQMFPSW